MVSRSLAISIGLQSSLGVNPAVEQSPDHFRPSGEWALVLTELANLRSGSPMGRTAYVYERPYRLRST